MYMPIYGMTRKRPIGEFYSSGPASILKFKKFIALWRPVESIDILARGVIFDSFFPENIILCIFYHLFS